MSSTIRKRPVLLALPILAVLGAAVHAQSTDIDRQVDELMQRMTLDEKIGQLNQYSSFYDVTGPAPTDERGRTRLARVQAGLVGSMLNVTGVEATRKAQELAVENSRLGIPMLFAYDVVHGYKTIFPIPLGESASWDLEAIELSARIAATEAAAAGLHWTFAPMVDISRDARWGRVMEGAGEDPFLGSAIAAARVRGFQGDDLGALDTVAACAKHFAAYGLAEAGRDYNTVDISESTLRNVVLPPFRAAIDAGVATVMTAFNEIGGTPATGSTYLQRDILKDGWSFDGVVVSDWGSISEMIAHGVVEGPRDAAALAINAGTDMDMESDAYVPHLAELVESGVVAAKTIDDAVRRILTLKARLGLFEDPYRYSVAKREKKQVYSAKHRAAAREVARKSIVLLKNDGLLPLAKNTGTIAVIGPLADDKDSPLGSWRASATPNSAVSLLEGIQAAVGRRVQVRYAQGAPLGTGERSFLQELALHEGPADFSEAVEVARGADVVVVAVGEEAFQSGEGRSQVDIGLKGVQDELLRKVHEANPNVVVVVMNGRPLVLNWMADNVPSIVEAWHLGSEAGNAIADVLFGDYNPSGKLPVSFPRHVGQLPLYYNHKNTGRPGPSDMVFWSHYTDAPNTPLFPFGYGLSYTEFDYSDLTLSAAEIGFDGTIQISVKVTNKGERAGAEVVQLYVRDRVASLTRPVKELKGFEKIQLEPGAVRTVTFTLSPSDLAFYNPRHGRRAEPGEFDVFVGPNSRDTTQAKFRLTGPGGQRKSVR